MSTQLLSLDCSLSQLDWPSCIVLAKIHYTEHSGIAAGAYKQLAAVVVVDNEDCSEDLSDESASCCARQAFLLQTNTNVTGRCLQVASIQAVFSFMSVTVYYRHAYTP